MLAAVHLANLMSAYAASLIADDFVYEQMQLSCALNTYIDYEDL